MVSRVRIPSSPPCFVCKQPPCQPYLRSPSSDHVLYSPPLYPTYFYIQLSDFSEHICARYIYISAIYIDDQIPVILTYLALLQPILSIVANFHQYQRDLTQIRLISCQLARSRRRLELTETKHIRSQSKKCVICATTASEHDCGKPEFEFS